MSCPSNCGIWMRFNWQVTHNGHFKISDSQHVSAPGTEFANRDIYLSQTCTSSSMDCKTKISWSPFSALSLPHHDFCTVIFFWWNVKNSRTRSVTQSPLNIYITILMWLLLGRRKMVAIPTTQADSKQRGPPFDYNYFGTLDYVAVG